MFAQDNRIGHQGRVIALNLFNGVPQPVCVKMMLNHLPTSPARVTSDKIGFAIAVSVLVGQNLGNNRPDLAERGVYSGFHITFLYMASIALLYVCIPNILLLPYASQADPATFEKIRKLAVILLRFVAVYSLFDSLMIIFASAVKGAGDTRFAMFLMLVLSVFVFIIPSYVALVWLNAGIYTGWGIASAYISILGLSFLFRFLGGKWKSMRVIEEVPPFSTPALPESPVAEFEL